MTYPEQLEAYIEQLRAELMRVNSALAQTQREADKWKTDCLRAKQDNAGYIADAEEALQLLDELRRQG